MFPKQSEVSTNRLIAALPANDRQRLLAGCEPVELEYCKILVAPADRIAHVYFPTESFLSLTLPVVGHADLEVGLVGDEGMVGTPLVLGVKFLGLSALVQGPGHALRMPAKTFMQELEYCPALQTLLKRYLFVVMCQLAQSSVCHRFHLVEARLARWLLMTRDRAHVDRFAITHESLAYMLGVRRVGITNAAGALQKRKLIAYSRGELEILDHRSLQAVSCPCYELDRSTYKRIMNRRLPSGARASLVDAEETAGSADEMPGEPLAN